MTVDNQQGAQQATQPFNVRQVAVIALDEFNRGVHVRYDGLKHFNGSIRQAWWSIGHFRTKDGGEVWNACAYDNAAFDTRYSQHIPQFGGNRVESDTIENLLWAMGVAGLVDPGPFRALKPTGTSQHPMEIHRRQPSFRTPPEDIDMAQAADLIFAEMCVHLPGGDLLVEPADDGRSVEIVRIIAANEGNGAGTNALKAAIQKADELDVRLVLTPDGTYYEDLEAARARLQAWYARFGFSLEADGTMSREAGTPAEANVSSDGGTGSGARAMALHRVLKVLDRVGELGSEGQVGLIDLKDVEILMQDPELIKVFQIERAAALARLSLIRRAADEELEALGAFAPAQAA